MRRRVLFVVMAAVAVVAILGVVKTLQIRSAIAEAASFQMPPEAVTTVQTKLEPWPQTLEAIGSIEAVRGVVVSADLPGVVEAILFESGQPVREGAVLVRLDARQERAQLKAAEAQLALSAVNLGRVRGLVSEGIVAQAELDRSTAEHDQAEARVGEIRATIERKTIRAPFSGVLGIRQVNLGQYLAGGAPVVPLSSLDPLHVDFSVPQQQVGLLRPGTQVQVSVEGVAEAPTSGTITAVDSVVDEATRNVRLQATIPNPEGRLRPGMFVQVQARVGESARVVALPASAVNYAPYGNSVFVVEEMQGQGGTRYKGARQQFVKLGPARGDQVAVLEGIEAGAEVVTSGVFKLRNGAAVRVDNDVRPSDDPAPRPEDN
jgi:membrane fusion protein (multidrug efflux system)